MDQSPSRLEIRLPSAFTIPLVQILVGVLLFIALINRQHDLTVLGLLVFAMGAGTKIWTRFGARGVSCSTELDKQRVYPAEPFTLSVTVENAKFLPVSIGVSVSFGEALPVSGAGPDFHKSGSLLWYQRMRVKWNLTALHRGVFRMGPPQVAAGDLFGFDSKRIPPIRPIELIVYPRLVPIIPFPMPRRDFFGIPGSKSPVEDPVYVYGLRDYQAGRSARFIHWKASARFSRLQEKICEPAEQEKILLVVDVSQFFKNRAQAEFEACLEAAASTAVRLDHSGLAVGFATNGILDGGGPPVLQIGRSSRQLPRILETLARLKMEPSGPMTSILRAGLRLPWGASCVSFAYNDEAPAAELASHFKQCNVPHVSVVCRTSDRISERVSDRMPEKRESDRLRNPAQRLILQDILMKETRVEKDCR